jgi:hypothetical protein
MSSRKKNPGPGAPSKSMERLAWPETAEYTVLMRDLSTLLQDRIKHPVFLPRRIYLASSMLINATCSGTHRVILARVVDWDVIEERS